MMNRTMLIGLDGATYSVIDPLMEEGVMPFLRDLTDAGARAELRSTPLPLTPPAWTSLASGRSPGEHGGLDFVRVEPGREHPVYTLTASTDVRCERIWSIASRQGRRVVCLNFPLMFPPEPLNGFMVPGFVPWRHLPRSVYPPELYQRLKHLPGFNPRELALDYDLEKKAIQALPDQEYDEWIRFHARRERQWFELYSHFLLHEEPDLIAGIFDGPDKLQHVCWRFLDRELLADPPTVADAMVRDQCLDYFRQLDRYIEALVRLAGPDTRVVLASDHGFGPTNEIFYVNVLLEQLGFLRWSRNVPHDREGRLTADGHRSSVVLFDWADTTACALTASSNGVWIRVAGDGDVGGISPEDYGEVRGRIIDGLLAFRDPDTGERVVQEILTREQAFPGAASQQAPDLTLVLRDHGFISVLNADQPLKPRGSIIGVHRPEGTLIAAGPGIRSGVVLPEASILDVAPTLLHSLGLQVPEDFEGHVITDLFEPSLLEEQPVAIGPRTEPPSVYRTEAAHVGLTPDDEEQVVERLTALGYLE